MGIQFEYDNLDTLFGSDWSKAVTAPFIDPMKNDYKITLYEDSYLYFTVRAYNDDPLHQLGVVGTTSFESKRPEIYYSTNCGSLFPK